MTRAMLRFFAATFLWLVLANNSSAYENVVTKFLTLDKAHITAYVDKTESSLREVKDFGPQALPWKWDDNITRKSGVLHAEFKFSEKDFQFIRLFSAEPLAVYALNMGNRYRYALNDEPWSEVEWTQPTSNYRPHVQWFLLDTSYLMRANTQRSDVPLINTLRIQMIVEPNNSSGITPIQIGPAQPIRWYYQKIFDTNRIYTLLVAAVAFFTSLISIVFWATTKERIYLLAFILELCFGLRYLFILWVAHPPIPTWAWNCLLMSLFSTGITCSMLLGLRVASDQQSKLTKAAHTLLWALPGLLLIGALLDDHRFRTLVSAVLTSSFVFYFAVIFRHHIKRPKTESLFFCVATFGALILGIHDLVFVQIDPHGFGRIRLLPLGNVLFGIAIGAIVVARYRRDSRALFASKIEARLGAEAATLKERHRMMTDLHDTVGAQLTGLVSLVRSDASKETLEEHTQMAIDDLRIAINSLQAVEGKLEVALASFRRVIQPRLDAVGIKLVWRIEELPELANFGSDKVLQLQKILQEVFANILKHSCATEVVFSAKPAVDVAGTLTGIQVTVSDNGKGFDASVKSGGIGLSNIQVRTQSIGANLKLVSQPSKGTKVEMMFHGSSTIDA